ncbi:9473_t:CDS:2, partial [Diversispora eburnea]
MTHLQFPEGFLERVNRLRRELNEISREAQLMINGTGAYLMVEGCEINLVEGCKINLVESSNNEGAPQENDVLLPYALDIVAALAEMHDLTGAMLDHDKTQKLCSCLPGKPDGCINKAGVTRALSSKWDANLLDSAEDKNTHPRSQDITTKELPA